MESLKKEALNFHLVSAGTDFNKSEKVSLKNSKSVTINKTN